MHALLCLCCARLKRTGPAAYHLLRDLSRPYASSAEDILGELHDFEKLGVPDGAGQDGSAGFDLGRMRSLLNALGNPHQTWPAIHIAGSKGKGSTGAFLTSILRQSLGKVGTYSSPHLHSICERIQINGQPISQEDLDRLAREHRFHLEQTQRDSKGALTHFEAFTALAFKHYQKQGVDMGVIEAGLGGARDATNVFDDQLQLAVITAIGMEHSAALGGTLEAIAHAKSGIMKPGVPVVIGHQPEPAVKETLEARAAELDCPIYHADACVRMHKEGLHMAGDQLRQMVVVERLRRAGDEPLPGGAAAQSFGVSMSLAGNHQLQNAATAMTAIFALRDSGALLQSTATAIIRGLEEATLPGRFQVGRMEGGDLQHAHWLVCDGAHTPASSKALAETLRQVFPDAPLALIIGMATDKDHLGFCKAIREARPAVAIFCSPRIAGASDRSAAPGMVVAQWQAAGMTNPGLPRCRELIQASMGPALQKAKMELDAHNKPGVVCVTGSLHAVGEALQLSGLA